MTFFARVTSDLTRSWLLYQGLIFVLVMLFLPQGIGGLIAVHARRWQLKSMRQLAFPYVLCALSGVLILVAVIFVVESGYTLTSDAYLAQRRAADGSFVPYVLLGWRLDPRSPLTWAMPALLLVAGCLLLPFAKHRTELAWALATREGGP